MLMMHIMITIVMFFTLAVFIYTFFHTYMNTRNFKRNIKPSWYVYIIIAAPFLYIAFQELPLPLFYLVIYFTGYISIQEITDQKQGTWLLVNIRFLMFATPHLMILGILAFFTGFTIPELLEDPILRCIGMTITLCLNIFLNSAVRQFFDKNAIHSLGLGSEEFQLFSSFVWFCTMFVMLDSIPCLIDLPMMLSSLFMLGSNLLLLLMLYLFARHIYTIAYNAFVKDELEQIKMEEAKQHDQTKKWEERAFLDRLTGAYTRVYAYSNVTAMLQNKESFILVFLDLDGLKQINDQTGHMQGDLYLKQFVKHMKQYMRPNDVLARLGGDEFLAIMPDIDVDKAEKLIQRCQEAGTQTPFSYGMVAIPSDTALTTEEWIAQADHKMYEDKQKRKGVMRNE